MGRSPIPVLTGLDIGPSVTLLIRQTMQRRATSQGQKVVSEHTVAVVICDTVKLVFVRLCNAFGAT